MLWKPGREAPVGWDQVVPATSQLDARQPQAGTTSFVALVEV